MTVRLVPSSDLRPGELARLRSLFDAAWADEGFDEDDWEHTFGGVHALWERDGEIVAHASVVPRELRAGGRRLRTGYVEGVATDPVQRGRGFGTAVMHAANSLIRDDFEIGALGTGLHDFYARLGWELWRGPLSVRGPAGEVRTAEEEGFVMVLRTAATDDLDMGLPLSCDHRPGDVW